MRLDRKGDMGFMEAMVAFMAVTIVLTGYMGVLATTTVDSSDPAGMLDPDRFTGSLEDGVFVPGFTEYLEGFVWSNGYEGASVVVTVPGFCEESGPYLVGTLDGSLFGRTIAGVVSDGYGRTVPAVYEVVVCV